MHAVAGWVHAVAGWVHTCYMYDCRFGHHHIVDPRTGQLLKCGREAPALAAVEAASCALADALATALLVCVGACARRRWQRAHRNDDMGGRGDANRSTAVGGILQRRERWCMKHATSIRRRLSMQCGA